MNTCIPTSGTSGRDKLSGSKWDDNIVGFGGDDTLSGNAGEDWLFGAGGNDALNGGTGIDWLFGGIGNDSLSGGAGADLFIFNAFGFGRDVITDFRASEGDKVDLRALNIDFDDLTIARSGRHPGFKRSSQHRLVFIDKAARQAPPPAFSSPVSFSVGH